MFLYNVKTGDSTLLKQQEVPGGFDAANYASERLWFPVQDGTEVPVSLVYRRGAFEKNSTSPLYVYGYGSYGYPLPLGFSASRLALLDRGVVVAYAHVRGGGELPEVGEHPGAGGDGGRPAHAPVGSGAGVAVVIDVADQQQRRHLGRSRSRLRAVHRIRRARRR